MRLQVLICIQQADFQSIKSKLRGGRLTDDFVSLANKATVKEYVSGQKTQQTR